MVEAHLLQDDGGEKPVACGCPVGEAGHGGVEVVALFLRPVVGVDDQLRERCVEFISWYLKRIFLLLHLV